MADEDAEIVPTPPLRLRVVSDGHPHNTHITDAETGRHLSFCEFHVRIVGPDNFAELTLVTDDFELDTIADLSKLQVRR